MKTKDYILAALIIVIIGMVFVAFTNTPDGMAAVRRAVKGQDAADEAAPPPAPAEPMQPAQIQQAPPPVVIYATVVVPPCNGTDSAEGCAMQNIDLPGVSCPDGQCPDDNGSGDEGGRP